MPVRELVRAIGAVALTAGDDPRLGCLRAALRREMAAAGVGLVGSARLGLHWLLAALAEQHPGGEVLLWGYNFFAVPDMVRQCGLVPVFIDADDASGEPSLQAAERLVGPRTCGLLVSHHFGRPATMDVWTGLATRHGLTVIEDCAHAFGARWGDRSVGLFGAGGAFSLSLTKGLTGVAGGVVVTADPAVAEALARWEASLAAPSFVHVAGAFAGALVAKLLFSRPSYAVLVHTANRACNAAGADPLDRLMTEAPAPPVAPVDLARRLAPAFAEVALAHLPSVGQEIQTRRAAARAILAARNWQRLDMPAWETDRLATYLNFVVRTPEPDALRRHLLADGFDTRRDYLGPMADARTLPVATRLARQGVYLPVRSLSAAADVDKLIASLTRFDVGSPMRSQG